MNTEDVMYDSLWLDPWNVFQDEPTGLAVGAFLKLMQMISMYPIQLRKDMVRDVVLGKMKDLAIKMLKDSRAHFLKEELNGFIEMMDEMIGMGYEEVSEYMDELKIDWS